MRRRIRINTGILPWIWLCISLGALYALAIGLQKHLMETPYQNQQEFSGNLYIGAEPILVSVPQGAMIKSVLVGVGDDVRRGQTLVVLDKNLLFQRQSELQAQLQVLQYSRDCFLAKTAPPIPALTSGDADGSLQADLQIAAQKCGAKLDELQAPVTQFSAQLENLQTRADLIAKQIILRANTAANTPDRAGGSDAQVFLSLMLAKNELEKKINETKAALSKARMAAQIVKNEQAEGFSKQLAALRPILVRLKQNLRSPRIAAPVSGKIARLRIPSAGTYLRDDVTIMEIQQESTVDYRLQVFIPHDILNRLQINHPVEFRILGLGAQSPPLSGRILAPDRARSDHTVALWVQPSEDAVAYLQGQRPHMAQAQGISASAITLRLADRPLWLMVVGDWRKLQQSSYLYSWAFKAIAAFRGGVHSGLS